MSRLGGLILLAVIFIAYSCEKCMSCSYTYTITTIEQTVNGEKEVVTTYKGWVPKSIIETMDNVHGVITEYYSAKELDVNEGEVLEYIKTLNGWLLLKNQKGETGWVPQENTEPLYS